MRKKRVTLCVLLAVFAAVSITAVLVSRHEEKVEQIKNSGETILTIPIDTVTALSWTNEDGTFSFTKDEAWTYDGDFAFPVDEEKVNELLAQFEDFAAAFANPRPTVEEFTIIVDGHADPEALKARVAQIRNAIETTTRWR